MYLIDHEVLVRQVIMPHWRDQWQHYVVKVLACAVCDLFEQIRIFRISTLSRLNENSQVIVLEYSLNVLFNYHLREITLSDGASRGLVRVRCPDDDEVVQGVQEYLNKIRVIGRTIEIERYVGNE